MLIDTHRAVKDLSQEQAERIVDVVSHADAKVATKEDLKRAKLQIIVATTTLVGALLAIFEFLI